MYDVVIAGASFAGLAVANQLQGLRVLLVDKEPIGSNQTSACGTIYEVLQYWGLTEAALQIHHDLVLHTTHSDLSFRSPYPWCTFDYEQLCHLLFERSGAKFRQAAVLGIDASGSVLTSEGAIQARYIVDASGWRAVLASTQNPDFARNAPMNFGIETIRPIPFSGNLDVSPLHFWYDRHLGRGRVGWAFPRGKQISVGVGSYSGAAHLRDPLTELAAKLEIEPDGLHGTYFPHTLRPAAVGRIFVVGDAAGMCIGLTGEGIRPALFFGEACGRILREVCEGHYSLEEGLSYYQSFVDARRYYFELLSKAQGVLARAPLTWIDLIARMVQSETLRPRVFERYHGLTQSWSKKVNGYSTTAL